MIQETQNSGRFAVCLDELGCHCGKFQKLHLPCSQVFVACKYAHHDFEEHIAPMYRLDQVSKVYESFFDKLRKEDYWPPYTTG